MDYQIEIKAVGSSEYWFVTKTTKGWGLTKRDRYAHKFESMAAGREVVAEFLQYTPERMREYLYKDHEFQNSIAFNLYSLKNADTSPLKVAQKLYTFVSMEACINV